jgi:hypothetical protein
MAEASRAAFDQGFQQRVSGQLSYHRVGGHMWWVDQPALSISLSFPAQP